MLFSNNPSSYIDIIPMKLDNAVGNYVVYTGINGTDYDINYANQHLTVGNMYCVTEISDGVFFLENKGVKAFSSKLFIDAFVY
jgi:hypothetical protein